MTQIRRPWTWEQKWHQQTEDAKTEAEKLPYGKEREALERKARIPNQRWLSSSELKAPQ
jgi:hypothetical protein